MLNAEGNDHLGFPERNRVDNRRLNLLCHLRIGRLHETNLRPGLQCNISGQFQIIELLLKPGALIIQILGCLCILRKAGELRLLLCFFEIGRANFRQSLLPCQDVHRQLFEIGQIHVVHLIEHGGVLHERDLVLLQLIRDGRHIGLHLGISGLQRRRLILRLVKKAQNSLFVVVHFKVFELKDQVGHHFTGFPQILGSHRLQGLFRKIRQLFLCARPVIQDRRRIRDINLSGKIIHLFLLLRCQIGLLCQLFFRRLRRGCQCALHLQNRGLWRTLHL